MKTRLHQQVLREPRAGIDAQPRTVGDELSVALHHHRLREPVRTVTQPLVRRSGRSGMISPERAFFLEERPDAAERNGRAVE